MDKLAALQAAKCHAKLRLAQFMDQKHGPDIDEAIAEIDAINEAISRELRRIETQDEGA